MITLLIPPLHPKAPENRRADLIKKQSAQRIRETCVQFQNIKYNIVTVVCLWIPTCIYCINQIVWKLNRDIEQTEILGEKF